MSAKLPVHMREAKLPEHMRESAAAYVQEGRPPGSFLRAVLRNDLVAAFSNADDTNRQYMEQWAAWLYWDVPAPAWGSEEKVVAWIELGGLKGLWAEGKSG